MIDEAEAERFAALLGKPLFELLDLDALADGIIAHRDGKPFHANPDGTAQTVRRLSWSIGWNQRALRVMR